MPGKISAFFKVAIQNDLVKKNHLFFLLVMLSNVEPGKIKIRDISARMDTSGFKKL